MMRIRHWVGIIVVIVTIFRGFLIVLRGLSHCFFLTVYAEFRYLPGLNSQANSLGRFVSARPLRVARGCT